MRHQPCFRYGKYAIEIKADEFLVATASYPGLFPNTEQCGMTFSTAGRPIAIVIDSDIVAGRHCTSDSLIQQDESLEETVRCPEWLRRSYALT